jgi:hypothetical protein
MACGALFAIFEISHLMVLTRAIGLSGTTEIPWRTLQQAPLIASAALLLSVVMPALTPIQKFVEAFADRSVIFLYILMPLSVLGLLIIVFNNLF